MNGRSALGSFQLPVAGFGALLLVGSAYELATLSPAPPQSDGFVRGLAALFLYGVAYVGFVVFALGLTIPPMGGYGVSFSRKQRLLFGSAAVFVLAGLVLPLVGFGIFYGAAMDGNATVVLLMWVAPTLLGVIALTGGLVWRVADTIRSLTTG